MYVFCFCGRTFSGFYVCKSLVNSTQTAFVMTLLQKRVLLQFAETLMEMKLDLYHHNLHVLLRVFGFSCGPGYESWRFASYLVDPASSHMLVSRIKPCMSKFKRFILWDCGRLIISVIVYLMVTTTRITVVILELILALKTLLCLHLLDFPPICFAVRWIIVTKRIKTSVLTLHSSFCPISFRR